MAKYIVKVDPRPTDTIYIQFSDGLKETECQIQDDTTIELDGEPKEIHIRRKTTLLRSFTKWSCRYVTLTLESDEKEFYFPVFGEISSAGKTIKEYSAKLAHQDSSVEREDSLAKNRQFKERLEQHGKEAHSYPSSRKNEEFSGETQAFSVSDKLDLRRRTQTAKFTDVGSSYSTNEEASSASSSFILRFFLRVISIFPEKLNFTHKPGLPGFVKAGNVFDLPKELWFETLKLVTLVKNAFKIFAQTNFRRLWNAGRKWVKIDDIRRVFWFPSKKAAYISQNWKNDAFFGSLFINGCNPIMIKKYTEDQKKIPLETLEMFYPDIRASIRNGSIYVVDYELLDDLPEGEINNSSQFLAAPIILLQETKEELMPIAIQLKQRPGKDNPVFFPKDKPEAWILAKIWVRNSDFYIHELVSHLLRTHLMAEIFFIASYSMADQHPLSRLLRVTGRYTLPINITARNTLINEEGFFSEFTAFENGAQWQVLERATKDMTYQSLCLPDNLKFRGVEDLKSYTYRDDGMAIWDAIYEFVEGVVNCCYKSEEAVWEDKELQEMVTFIYHYGFLQKPDCPSSLTTREEATKYITMIMFTCSAQHASVNNGQYDIYAWMPNGPTTMRKPPPEDKEVTEACIMSTLPEITTTLESMKVARFLSQVPQDFVPLGQYPDEVAFEKHMRNPIAKFQKKLKEIGEKIDKRCCLQDFPYDYMHPGKMENSITI